VTQRRCHEAKSRFHKKTIEHIKFLKSEGRFIKAYNKHISLRKAIANMVSKISEGVEISVETFYQADYSNPVNHEFMFAYRITIENHNAFTVQLLQRHWYIFDSNSEHREVEGEPLVGVQPVLKPGEQFQYVSGCNLKTELGKMQGYYTMQNLNSKQNFTVKIPAFQLIVPIKLN
jgi:ApaG protein